MSHTHCLWLLAIAACAGTTANTPPPVYSGHSGSPCSYIGLEADAAPVHDEVDASSLVAVYRLRDPNAPPSDPFELKFLVHQSRTDELHGALAAHPDVICSPAQDAQP